MLSRFSILFWLLVWGVGITGWAQEQQEQNVTVLEQQPYSEVLSVIANAETNVTLLVAQPDAALVNVVADVAGRLIGIAGAVEADSEIRRDTGEGNIYFVRGPEPVEGEAMLTGAGVQVRSLPGDFPRALILVDFSIILAANVPEDVETPGPISSFTWEIVTVPELPEDQIKEISGFWEVALTP